MGHGKKSLLGLTIARYNLCGGDEVGRIEFVKFISQIAIGCMGFWQIVLGAEGV